VPYASDTVWWLLAQTTDDGCIGTCFLHRRSFCIERTSRRATSTGSPTIRPEPRSSLPRSAFIATNPQGMSPCHEGSVWALIAPHDLAGDLRNVVFGSAISSSSHQKRHDGKHRKHHIVDRSRDRVSAGKVLPNRHAPKPEHERKLSEQQEA
jgi:hypothetical protein